MNCTVTSAKKFSGQSGIISRIYPVQSAVSVRKSIPDRPFIFPILMLAKCSQDSAYRDILDLIERGALKKEIGGGRSTSYSLVND